MIKNLLLLKAIILISACSATNNNWVMQDETAAKPLVNVSYASLRPLAKADNSIVLKYGSAEQQFGRLYLPSSTAAIKKVPLLIFVHGGCWLNAYDLSHSTAFSQALAEAGIAVWSVEYRRVGDNGGGWPGSLNDVQQAVEYAVQRLNNFPLDLNRVALAGHSAGGQLALLAGKTTIKPQLRAVLGLAAITDLTAYSHGTNSCQRATSAFMGGTSEQLASLYQLASPKRQALHESTLLFHGSSDIIVPQTQAYIPAVPYKIIENAGHFDWLHPQTEAFDNLLQYLKEQFAK
jgi:acetyl esterase/lipase